MIAKVKLMDKLTIHYSNGVIYSGKKRMPFSIWASDVWRTVWNVTNSENLRTHFLHPKATWRYDVRLLLITQLPDIKAERWIVKVDSWRVHFNVKPHFFRKITLIYLHISKKNSNFARKIYMAKKSLHKQIASKRVEAVIFRQDFPEYIWFPKRSGLRNT